MHVQPSFECDVGATIFKNAYTSSYKDDRHMDDLLNRQYKSIDSIDARYQKTFSKT